MKQSASILTIALAACLLTGCASQQFAGVAMGSNLGGLFGSSIGGLTGGLRGHDLGGAIGMLVGGAAGAALTAPRGDTNGGHVEDLYNEAITYRRQMPKTVPTASQWATLGVADISFADSNGNRCIDSGERATIVMNIFNRGTGTLYDIAPVVKCSDRRIVVSPPAIVSCLDPGQGFRYTVEVVAVRRLRDGTATFTVSFGQGRQRVVARSFNIGTRR